MRSSSTSSISWTKFDAVALFCLVFLNEYDASSITNPFRANGDISKVVPDYIDRKASKVYHNSTPHDLRELPIISYNSPDPDCNVGFKLTWTSTVGSPVYSSPVVFPSGISGICKTFSVYRSVMESLTRNVYQGLRGGNTSSSARFIIISRSLVMMATNLLAGH